MHKNIIVTGGAGFIGSNIVKELVKQKHSVTVIDNLHSGSKKNLNGIRDYIQFFQGSCGDIQLMKNPAYISLNLIHTDIIFHLGIASSSPMYKENPLLVGNVINDAISIFEHAKKTGAKVIFASSSSLYNGLKPPHKEDMDIKVTDYYTEARYAIERIAKLYNILYGVKSAGLRFFSVYGPNEEAKGQYANMISQFIWDMKNDKSSIIYGDGNQTRDCTYVKDVVDICTLLMDKDFEYEIYNVGTGISYSFNDIIAILQRKLNKNIEPTYIKMPIKNYVPDTLADISKIKQLGYLPKYSLEKGLDEII